MLGLESVITDRIRETLLTLGASWECFGYTTDAGNRDRYPLASVQFADSALVDTKTGAVNVMPGWLVTLVTRKGAQSAMDLDEAFSAVIQALHNWPPGVVSGRPWNRLSLQSVRPPQYPPDGLIGLELTFTTHARYDGQI